MVYGNGLCLAIVTETENAMTFFWWSGEDLPKYCQIDSLEEAEKLFNEIQLFPVKEVVTGSRFSAGD